MANGRQVLLRRGPLADDATAAATIVNLTGSPYVLLAEDGFVSAGETLEIKLLMEATTLAELERLLAPLRQMLTQGEMHTGLAQGEPVEVWTKVCDAVASVPEVGAGWTRKRVLNGTVIVNPLTGTAAAPSARVTLTLEVGQTWRRALPGQVLVAPAASTDVTVRSDGGITSNGAALTARRQRWTATSGVTVRYRWLAAERSCGFFALASTSIAAGWDNTTKQFIMSDDATIPNTALSAVHTFTAGQEIDVVFRWKPGVSMAIWVNGVADGTAAACTFGTYDTPTVLDPTGSHTILSLQIWPTALTDAECAGLYAWGRPEPELAFVVPPVDNTNTYCQYLFFNMPGDAPGGLRVLWSRVGGEE